MQAGVAAPYPDSVEDVSMDSGADKRSRESPDSTLKPEGKSLRTSETTTAPTTMDTDEMSTADNVKPSNVTKRPKSISEAKSLMREVHKRMPAWKAEKLLETRKVDQVDLAALGEATEYCSSPWTCCGKLSHIWKEFRMRKPEMEMLTWVRLRRLTLNLQSQKIKIRMRGERSDNQKEKNTAPSGGCGKS